MIGDTAQRIKRWVARIDMRFEPFSVADFERQ
jgi:hypothetical protein